MALPAAGQSAGPATRDLARINWTEFREACRMAIRPCMLPLGTLEPHGVTANGADIIAPGAIAEAIAPRVDAMVAPVIPYGLTGSMDAYPGAFTVPSEAYQPYVRAVLVGLARNGFKNLILINAMASDRPRLSASAREVGQAEGVRTLVVNWWSYCSDITLEVFGEDGGHAGDNETAFMQAIDKSLVHPGRYTGPEMTTANAGSGSWSEYPSPSSIGLYQVASSVAWKSGDTPSGCSTERACGARSPKRERISGDVVNAIAKSPLPLP